MKCLELWTLMEGMCIKNECYWFNHLPDGIVVIP